MNYKQIIKKIYLLPCICFFVIIFRFSWTNWKICENLKEEITMSNFKGYTESLENKLADNLEQKYSLINLNGLMANILGINTLNEIQKLKNGWLASFSSYSEQVVLADKIKNLSDFCIEEHINYLCVPIPGKANSYDADFALGYESNGHETIEKFISDLHDRNINYLDMDSWFENNGWGIQDIYFKTDLHWKPEAAFATSQEIMENLSDNYDIIYNKDSLDLDNWTIDLYKNWFLGSEGKRTGALYAGQDDLSFLSPNYETDIYVERLSSARILDKNHEKNVYITDYLDKPDYYLENPYCIYLGGDYPYIYINNSKALNDKKIIVIGDSYRLPIECFLSTQFSEIYHIDMRHYVDGTFVEFVKEINPDIVLSLFTGLTDDERHDYGLEKWNTDFKEKKFSLIYQVENVKINESENNSNFYVIESNLESGSYEINIEQSKLIRNSELNNNSAGIFIQMSLLNLKDNSIEASRYFITDYGEKQKWLFTVPDDIDANYSVVVYSGVCGDTSNNSIDIRNIRFGKYE